MFICQSCKAQSKAGEGQTKLVTDFRKKTYENLIKRGKKTFTVKSEGFEIVKEIAVCAPCAQKPLA